MRNFGAILGALWYFWLLSHPWRKLYSIACISCILRSWIGCRDLVRMLICGFRRCRCTTQFWLSQSREYSWCLWLSSCRGGPRNSRRKRTSVVRCLSRPIRSIMRWMLKSYRDFWRSARTPGIRNSVRRNEQIPGIRPSCMRLYRKKLREQI